MMAKQYFTTVLAKVERGEIDDAYLLLGDNYYQQFLLTELILKAKIPAGQRAYSKHSMSGEKANPSAVEECLYGVPLFGGDTVVVINNINRVHANHQKFLIKAVEKRDRSVTVVATAKKLDMRGSFPRALAKLCTVVDLKELNNTQLPPYIKTRFASRGFTIDDDAVFEFCRVVGRDCGEIEEEVTKISYRFSEQSHLSLDQIKSYLSASRHYSQYEVAGYLGNKQIGHSLTALRKYLESGGADARTRLVYALYQQLERMLHYKNLSGSMSREALAGRLHMPAFYLKDLAKQAGRYSEEELVEALLGVYQAEVDDRFSAEPRRQIFERMLINILSQQAVEKVIR